MRTENILDWNLLTALGTYPVPGEEVYAAITPALKPVIPGVSNLSDSIQFWVAYYSCVIMFPLAGMFDNIYGDISLTLAVVFFVQALPAIRNYYSIHRTLYVVTNKRVVFRLWRNFQEKTQVVYWRDVEKVSCLVYVPRGKKGAVLLQIPGDAGFQTFDLNSAARRDHPSLEGISEPEKLARQIEQFRQESTSRS